MMRAIGWRCLISLIIGIWTAFGYFLVLVKWLPKDEGERMERDGDGGARLRLATAFFIELAW